MEKRDRQLGNYFLSSKGIVESLIREIIGLI